MEFTMMVFKNHQEFRDYADKCTEAERREMIVTKDFKGNTSQLQNG